MPIDSVLCTKVWARYQFCRDNGHNRYVEKAEECERYFAGEHWTDADVALLREQRRPALTINKILSTISNVMGEQIYNRSEISFRPRTADSDETAEALNKVFKQISDKNQLDWKRSDMFADGIITSRGFLDVRITNGDNMQGEVSIETVNPKNIILDPDGEQYDPDTWNEVFVTKWVTADDIAILYNRDDAEILRNREQSFFPYGYDSIERHRDRFGDRIMPGWNGPWDQSNVLRNIRIIERQHRVLDNQKHFVDPKNGDMRPIPSDWDRNRIALMVEQHKLMVVPKLVHRLRWSVIADNVRLFDDWSPYKHITIVPYFPYFRRGNTIGLVENLIGPQELLNKVSSQELHVVNTTANSGWKVKAGALTNMSIEELESRGAQTGLVIELNGDLDDIEKIQPNQTPNGLDRISYKAEEHIKTISGVGDSQMGQDREDVAAKAIQAKRQASSTNMVKPLDSLVRSDYLLARNILDLVQEFYSDERIITITKDHATGDTEQTVVNHVTPDGQIVNDLTLGEYDVIVSSVPARETLEDSQFDQAISMKQEGIPIPDSVIIESSRLMRKREILQQMNAATDSPEAKAQAQLQQQLQQAELAKLQAEAQQKGADAGLKQAKAGKETITAQKDAMTPPETEQQGVQGDMQLEREKFEFEKQLKLQEFQLKRDELVEKQRLAQQELAHKVAADRADRVIKARQGNKQPGAKR